LAIEFVFNVILARKSEIDANYPGGFGVDVVTSNETKPPGEVVSRWNWLAFDTRQCRRELPGGSVVVFDIPRYWLKGEQPGETVNSFGRRPRTSTSAASGTSRTG